MYLQRLTCSHSHHKKLARYQCVWVFLLTSHASQAARWPAPSPPASISNCQSLSASPAAPFGDDNYSPPGSHRRPTENRGYIHGKVRESRGSSNRLLIKTFPNFRQSEWPNPEFMGDKPSFSCCLKKRFFHSVNVPVTLETTNLETSIITYKMFVDCDH